MTRFKINYTTSKYADHLTDIAVKTLREVVEDNSPVPPCKKHPRYKRIRKPGCDCAPCWDYYNDRPQS